MGRGVTVVMTPSNQDTIRQILSNAGVPKEVTDPPFHMISIYKQSGASGSNLRLVLEEAKSNARSRQSILDLGWGQSGLSDTQAFQIKEALTEAGLRYLEENLADHFTSLKAPSGLPQQYQAVCDFFGVPEES